MFPIPSQYLTPYLISNAVALALLVTAFWRPAVTRWCVVLIFAAASIVNAWHATFRPSAYIEYGDLALLASYARFIHGWFSQHVPVLVYPIAVGQFVIAALLTRATPLRRLGVLGAAIFLLAIAPLGVGSAFPFSLTMVAALLVMERSMTESEWHEHLQIRTFNT